MLHAESCQLKLGVLTLPNGDNKNDIKKNFIINREIQFGLSLSLLHFYALKLLKNL